MSRKETGWIELPVEVVPGSTGCGGRYLGGDEFPRQAAADILERAGEPREAGSAWRDPQWRSELQAMHRALGATAASSSNIERLGDGAACVVTGQQPAVLGGPLYCAYKIAGCVALAEELSRRHDRSVVPVYWCGSDDSDFDEARATWLWSAGDTAFRAELPASSHRRGEMVGSIAGPELVAVEQSARRAMGNAPGGETLDRFLDALDPDWDLFTRTASLYLQLFGHRGLVVVDARSAPLRRLYRPLLERYGERHREIAAAVDARGQEFARAGLSVPLDAVATRSGVFRVDGIGREKVEAEALVETLSGKAELSASVLLRPLVQDHLLGPAASVLGPSERAYHAQLTPAYEALGVDAASPYPRPHLVSLATSIPWPNDTSVAADLLAGGERGLRAEGSLAMPAKWEAAQARLTREVDAALKAFSYGLGPTGRSKPVVKGSQRVRLESERLISVLGREALRQRAAENQAWSWTPEWVGPGGKPQERAFAAITGLWWWGDGFVPLLDELGRRSVCAWVDGRPPAFAVRLPDEESSS